MKYLIEGTSKKGRKGEYDDVAIPVEICIDGERENISIIFDLGGGKDWWISITELDHLMYIIEGLLKK